METKQNTSPQYIKSCTKNRNYLFARQMSYKLLLADDRVNYPYSPSPTLSMSGTDVAMVLLSLVL